MCKEDKQDPELLRIESEIARNKAEKEKFTEEVKDYQLPWYQKPKYLGVALPTLLGALTISAALFTDVIEDRISFHKKEAEKHKADVTDHKEQIDKTERDHEAHNVEYLAVTESIKQEKLKLEQLRKEKDQKTTSLNIALRKNKNYAKKIKSYREES